MYDLNLTNLSKEAIEEILNGSFVVIARDFDLQDQSLSELFEELQRAAIDLTKDLPEFADEPDPVTLAAGMKLVNDKTVTQLIWVDALTLYLIILDDGSSVFKRDGEIVELADGTEAMVPLRN